MNKEFFDFGFLSQNRSEKVTALDDQYFKNLDEIEKLWKKATAAKFTDRKANDALFGKCSEGRNIFYQVMSIWFKQDGFLPPKIPSYERAIMLLEKEQKWKTAMELVNSAIKIGIEKHGNTDWYTKRKAKIQKKIK